jgi:glycoprotein endo-alpha-1,2-mannosidase
MKKLLICSILLLLLLAGCTVPPAATPAQTFSVNLPVWPTAEPSNTPTPTWEYRFTIMTTSDWTRVKLVGGMTVAEHAILSASQDTLTAGFDPDGFYLSQAVTNAKAGRSVELIVDISTAGGITPSDLVVDIDRGYLGSTTVVIQRHACGELRRVATLTWDSTQLVGRNSKQFTIPQAQLAGTSKNEYIVIAQLNFWYYGPGKSGGFENSIGGDVTAVSPWLGKYVASDPEVVEQQIKWAVDYGVDAFSIEWTTPRGEGCCGSMEDTLDDVFLKSPNIDKVRWAIFYDFPLRLMQSKGLEQYARDFNFDEPRVSTTLIADFKRFAKKYFGNPQYLTIDGRPVIYIWATNAFQGDLEGALREARQAVAEEGYDVYIVGDEVMAGNFDRHHASLFDANTTFTFLIPGLNPRYWSDIGDAIPEVDRTFAQWQNNIAGLHVIDRQDLVNFQPAWAPQYDERFSQIGNPKPTYVPAASKAQVTAMAEMARKYAVPAGSQGLKLIWVNTWNCWGETTSIEPTIDKGPKYPDGNYGFDFLEVVREVFGSETYACQSP